MIDYDRELARHHATFRRVLNIAATDQVLDIGCGSGETTREAARSASQGGALGIDLSQSMVDRARAIALEEKLHNVSFECADVARHAFASGQFELAISRFGTMFFADPRAAFDNIRQALIATGRLVMLVWQTREQNEWALEIPRAIASDEVVASMAPETWQAFSLGERDTVQHLLRGTGFAAVTLEEVHEAVFYGTDVDSAFAFVSQFSMVQDMLRSLTGDARKHSLDRLRTLLAKHHSRDGVWFDSRAWIVAALRLRSRRRPSRAV